MIKMDVYRLYLNLSDLAASSAAHSFTFDGSIS